MRGNSPLLGAQDHSLSRRVLIFCRALRRAGLSVSVGQAPLALTALQAVMLADPDEAYLALRTVLVKRPEEIPIFDRLFEIYFRGGALPAVPAPIAADQDEEPIPGRMEESADGLLSLSDWGIAEPEPDASPLELAAYSPAESVAKKDFSQLAAAELAMVERMVAVLARRLATRRSRRYRPDPGGTRLDLGRTLRRSLATGGEPVRLYRRGRPLANHRLVVLLDVSRSMEPYTRFLMQFLYALQLRLRGVESFVFSTRLSRVTALMRHAGYRQALEQMSRQAAGWSGGTRIGESLHQFVVKYGRAYLGPRSVVIILSDGWDMGEPDLVVGSMGELRRRSNRIIWLNPLLGSPTYRPETRGMKAALPYIHVFAGAHNVDSLRALIPLLHRRRPLANVSPAVSD